MDQSYCPHTNSVSAVPSPTGDDANSGCGQYYKFAAIKTCTTTTDKFSIPRNSLWVTCHFLAGKTKANGGILFAESGTLPELHKSSGQHLLLRAASGVYCDVLRLWIVVDFHSAV
ncbi:hypothetical protein PITC_044690 [Penicillium italicum]|uniref:Uncharacterized protein n=1 Tax=Penicillium italicum TaxID=40296 RepID=A0A0A2KUT2_PENIT|nr:hypothetical protein PITC_044690 [Penicillium italicum]